MIGHFFGPVVWHVADRNSMLSRSIYIYVVVSHSFSMNDSNALERSDHVARDSWEVDDDQRIRICDIGGHCAFLLHSDQPQFAHISKNFRFYLKVLTEGGDSCVENQYAIRRIRHEYSVEMD